MTQSNYFRYHSAYERGASAYWTGASCPYHIHDPEYNSWYAGYQDARYQDSLDYNYNSDERHLQY